MAPDRLCGSAERPFLNAQADHRRRSDWLVGAGSPIGGDYCQRNIPWYSSISFDIFGNRADCRSTDGPLDRLTVVFMTTEPAPTSPAGSDSYRSGKDLVWRALQSESIDPVVAQAIETVTSRFHAEDLWAFSPHERTEAIYDEVKRLDRARMNGPDHAMKDETGKTSPSDSMLG
jgi:hypothetical protein